MRILSRWGSRPRTDGGSAEGRRKVLGSAACGIGKRMTPSAQAGLRRSSHVAEHVPGWERPRLFRLKRTMLAVGAALFSINVWTGAPLFAIWVGSRSAARAPDRGIRRTQRAATCRASHLALAAQHARRERGSRPPARRDQRSRAGRRDQRGRRGARLRGLVLLLRRLPSAEQLIPPDAAAGWTPSGAAVETPVLWHLRSRTRCNVLGEVWDHALDSPFRLPLVARGDTDWPDQRSAERST
jgi:hypothetical protein